MFDRKHSIDEYVFETDRRVVRVLELRAVNHRVGVEDIDVGEEAGFEQAAIGELHLLRGQRSHLADGIFQGQHMLLANIFAENAGGAAIAARVRLGFAERAVGIDAAGVGAHTDPGLLHGVAQIVFAHREVNGADLIAGGDDQVKDGVERVLLLLGGNLGDVHSFIVTQRRIEHGGNEHAFGTLGRAPLVFRSVSVHDGVANLLALYRVL